MASRSATYSASCSGASRSSWIGRSEAAARPVIVCKRAAEVVLTRSEVYALASAEFSEKELVDLTLAVIAINSWRPHERRVSYRAGCNAAERRYVIQSRRWWWPPLLGARYSWLSRLSRLGGAL